jgi:Raf kinase inhibitor-like YbhB/YbcL family protein
MKLWSDSWTNGERIPARFAAGQPDGLGGAMFSDNLNPHLAWSDLPARAQSLALIFHDFDGPSRFDEVNHRSRSVPASLARIDFFHWVLIDLPAQPGQIEEGAFSRGFLARGKPNLPAMGGVRQGLNDFTGWYGANADLAGRYFGYDGPFPPWNDSLIHHYVFTLYALEPRRLLMDDPFTGEQVRRAMHGHVLGEATLSCTYTLNPLLLDSPH